MSELDMCQGLNYKLKEGIPQISEMIPQKVVSVSVNGDPNQQTAKLMTPLYATAYAIRKIYKEQGKVFTVEKLRGRWPHNNITKSKDSWSGIYALPVPNSVEQLPAIKPEKNLDGITINLEQWQYGQVAYILHIGSYTTEAGTIQKLLDFISASGYKIIPDSHEEIYLSDPTKVTADKLKTIILYRIEK